MAPPSILINNAGIIQDKSFKNMSLDNWNEVLAVHLTGMFNITKAVWIPMLEAKYGRIVNTSSYSGIYGSFGQANYATAKMGIIGFSKTLALEGKKHGINVNAIAPVAGTSMLETVLPKEAIEKLNPDFVAALVTYLCHESCDDTGEIFEVGGGHVSKLRI